MRKPSNTALTSTLSKLANALEPKKTKPYRVAANRKLAPAGKYLSALKDPFAENVCGVKIPDFDGNPSFTLASKDVLQIITDSSGYAGGALIYGSARNLVVSASNTVGVITMTGGSPSTWTDVSTGLLQTSNANASRHVAGGFKMTNLLSLAGSNPASGRLIIAPVSTFQFYNTGSFTESTLRKLPGCVVIPLAGLAASNVPVFGSVRPLDPSAFTYTAPNRVYSGVANDDPQLTNFFYMVVGAPASSSIIEIETVAHWEVLPTLTNAVLSTVGTASSYSTMEAAFNWAQENNPISWEYLVNFAAGYVNPSQTLGMPSLMNG
jgi:hypothetical protein